MKFKTPKVLEKKPIVAGFELKMVVIIVSCTMLFIFTVFTNVLFSLLFPTILSVFIYINNKYPREGELKRLINYKIGVKCIRFNKNLESIIIVKNKKKN